MPLCVGARSLVIEYPTRNFQVAGSNLTQVIYKQPSANVLCAQANSASYPQRDKKWVVAYGLWGEGLVWLIGAVVCLCAAPQVQLFC